MVKMIFLERYVKKNSLRFLTLVKIHGELAIDVSAPIFMFYLWSIVRSVNPGYVQK
jgi:hypothetical protein